MTHTYVSPGRVTIYQRQQIVINKVQLKTAKGRERAQPPFVSLLDAWGCSGKDALDNGRIGGP